LSGEAPPLLVGHAAWAGLARPPAGVVLAREEGRLDAAEYAALVRSVGLDRPVDDLPRMAAMLAASNLVVTARDGAGRLLGAARSVTDFAWCCYLSDLVVEKERQRGGLGRLLLAETKRAVGPGCMVLLLSTPSAMGYYPRLGMERMPNAFLIRRED
jgi:GNAT superfamily N-acetyltransferase